MAGLVIRPATPADAALIHQLIRELAEYENLLHEVAITVADVERLMFGPARVAEALIAEVDGQAVGYASFHHTLSTFLGKAGIWLEDLYVRQTARGQGHGKALLLHLARIAVERDCARLEWSVLDWNQPAIDFYRALGARPVDDWLRYRLDATGLATLTG
ncbi:GNAT family N-acetyltransferase [Zavarzinia sp. CC-PAN008]|uniref:GNAT family N-acetyltransferase n=1 Tax=Zavarzinia sp. CC-PAN008 TaxID=3243332 RepID=UPI003F74A8FE